MLYFYILIIAQIVLESFPVSSSGHVKLLEHFWGNSWRITSAVSGADASAVITACSNFYHLLHGITVILVAAFFFKDWFFLLINWRRCWRIIIKTGLLTALADSLTTCFFVAFIVINTSRFPLSVGFFITAFALYSLRWCPEAPRSVWSWRGALFLGCVQGIALLPGISRMGVTYVAARWLALPPYKAFQISLLIEWPLIAAAFLASTPLLWSSAIDQFLNPTTAFVMLGASIGAWCGLRLMLYLACHNRVWWLSYYMLIPCILSLFW